MVDNIKTATKQLVLSFQEEGYTVELALKFAHVYAMLNVSEEIATLRNKLFPNLTLTPEAMEELEDMEMKPGELTFMVKTGAQNREADRHKEILNSLRDIAEAIREGNPV